MLIRDARFVTSNTRVELCPAPTMPEYAFIGRSNVGKSSLLNMLTQRKGLAKTSQSPGKTQLINHFLINEEWYLVDLPGYGYARVSKESRTEWARMINFYLRRRENLACVAVLVDSRHEPQAVDLEFMEKLGTEGVPFVMVFTKTDKQSAARPQTEQGTGISSVGKIIPVAEYYEGGQAAMYDFISKELKYPLLAKRNRIQGQCIVSFTLNPDGTMSGIKLVKQLGGGTGDEALRVVHLLKFKKPEYPILTSLPINFKLGVTGSNAMN